MIAATSKLPDTGGNRFPCTAYTPVFIPSGILDEVRDALADRRIFVQDEKRLALIDVAINMLTMAVARTDLRTLNACEITDDGEPPRPPWLRHR